VSSTEVLRAAFQKIKRYKLIILAIGMLFALLLLFFAISKRTSYTSKATLFPLTSPSDNAISNSMLNGILGLNDAPKSFTAEATINIIELALSRSIREAVATTRLPKFENKMVVELLVNDINKHKTIFQEEETMPADSLERAIKGGELLKAAVSAKMSKNGVLELGYTGTDAALITPVSNVLIEKLSKFYIELKRQKALSDYNFTLDKIDSLQRMVNTIDREAMGMQKRTMFTPPDLLDYAIPKENISSEKTRIMRQRDMYINNRDEAVWRLQKVTPVIAVLDKPTAPFDEKSSSKILLTLIGFIIGCLLGTCIVLSGLLYRYAKGEIYKSIFGDAVAV
jgi:LPS O-antigen subunit length determinant protein (WzzB/FepE family)